jgi:hypothetical protein
MVCCVWHCTLVLRRRVCFLFCRLRQIFRVRRCACRKYISAWRYTLIVLPPSANFSCTSLRLPQVHCRLAACIDYFVAFGKIFMYVVALGIRGFPLGENNPIVTKHRVVRKAGGVLRAGARPRPYGLCTLFTAPPTSLARRAALAHQIYHKNTNPTTDAGARKPYGHCESAQ